MQSRDERITDLEIAITHQQRYLDELNGVMIDLSRRFEAITREIAAIKLSLRPAVSHESLEEPDQAE